MSPDQTFRKFFKKAGAETDKIDHSLTHDTTPWLSIITPVYNTKIRYLDELLKSYKNEQINGVELILSDDGSTQTDTLNWLSQHTQETGLLVIRNTENKGIAAATNAGISRATGKWVTFMDHDDLIAPHGLKAIRKTLLEDDTIKFLYTDELIVDDQLKIISSFMKPAYDPVLLSGVNYINHFSIYQRARLEEIGFLRTGFDGSQDYDLLLRYLDGLNQNDIVHLPYPAYFWRVTGESYSRTYLQKALSNARRSLKEHFKNDDFDTDIMPALNSELHRVNFKPKDNQWPSIGIIIPSRNSLPLIKQILSDLFEKTDYLNFQVVVVDNGSDDPLVKDLYKETKTKHPNFSYIITPEVFNFSRSINRGLSALDCDHFLLLNNDVEVIDGQWLKEMVSCLAFENVGIVGAKLLYENDAIQHAGVIIGINELAGHWFYNQPSATSGPMGRLRVRNSMTCVTGAVMLISGECVDRIGPWNEDDFAVAYNDVDYCLRAHKQGIRILWTPFACLYHHESVSRGTDKSKQNRQRFQQEKSNLKKLHNTSGYIDAASSPFFSTYSSVTLVKPPQQLPKPRRWFQN